MGSGVNNFKNDAAALRRSINNLETKPIGMDVNAYGGLPNTTAAHHLLPGEVFSGDLQETFSIAYAQAGKTFNIDDSANGVILPTTTAAQETAGGAGFFASQHAGDGTHVTYSSYVERTLLRFEKQYKLIPNPSLQDAQDFVARVENLQTFLRDGLVNRDTSKIVFFVKNIDLSVQSYLRDPDFTDQEILDRYVLNLETLDRIDFLDPVSVRSLGPGIGAGQSFVQGSNVVAANFNTSLGSNLDRVASKADGIVTTATILLGIYALTGAAQDVLGEDPDWDDIIDLIAKSNLSISTDLLTELANDTVTDAIISGLAALTGVGLLWKGYQIVQGAGDARAMLSLAAQFNAEDTSLAAKAVNELDDWITWIEGKYGALTTIDSAQSLADVAADVVTSGLAGGFIGSRLLAWISDAEQQGGTQSEQLNQYGANLTPQIEFILNGGWTVLHGSPDPDTIVVLGRQNHEIHGYGLRDEVFLLGTASDYSPRASYADGSVSVVKADGSQELRLYSIERLTFSDGSFLDLAGQDNPDPQPNPGTQNLPNLIVDDAEVKEGGMLAFRVHLDGEKASQPISFLATTYRNGTFGDYEGFIDRSFSIPQGASEVVVQVQTIDDVVPEGIETMAFNVHDVAGAEIASAVDGWAIGRILDDELAVEEVPFEGQSLSGTVTAGQSEYFAFTTTGSGTLRIDLTRLSADADLQILDNTFQPIPPNGIVSQNTGTQAERVEFHYLPNQRYFIQVEGKQIDTPFVVALIPEPGENRLPTAVDDTLSVSLNASGNVVIDVADLLRNDTDPDGNTLSITHIDGDGSGPSWVGNGSAALTGDQIVFTPDSSGADTGRFAYAVSDGQSIHRDWALVTLNFADTPPPSQGVDLAIENILVNDLPYLTWFEQAGRVIDPDGPFEVTFDVVNYGDTATPSSFQTGLNVSSGLVGIASFTGPLAPGAKVTQSFSPRLQEGFTGQVAFQPFADFHGQTGDVDLSNNTFTGRGLVAEPLPQVDVDFTIENVRINGIAYDEWIRGASQLLSSELPQFTFDIVNLGTADMPEGAPLSFDIEISGNPVLGSLMSSFSGGERRTVTLDPEIEHLDAGVHGFEISVDRFVGVNHQSIPETNESNNAFLGIVSVTDTPEPSPPAEKFGLRGPSSDTLGREEGDRWIIGVTRLGDSSGRAVEASIAYTGTATTGVDFTGATTVSLGANEGVEADGHGFIVSIMDDVIEEADIETLTVSLAGVIYADTSEIAAIDVATNRVSLAILDNDGGTGGGQGSEVRVAVQASDTGEGTVFRFELVDPAPEARPVTLNYTIDPGFELEGGAPEETSFRITLDPSAPVQDVRVHPQDDPDGGGPGITLTSVNGGYSPQSRIVDAAQPEPAEPGTIAVRAVHETRDESGAEGVLVPFEISRTNGSDGEVSVTWRVDDASPGADLGASRSGVVTFADGDMAPKTVTLIVPGDDENGPDKAVGLVLEAASGGGVLDPLALTASTLVQDDDEIDPGTIRISTTAAILVERDDASAEQAITVLRETGSDGAVSVAWSVLGGPSDLGPRGGTLSWADGESGAKTVTLSLPADML